MKILHRHLLKSLLVTLVVTLVVFTFVLLLGNIVKDLVVLLGNREVGFFTMAHFFVLLLPYVMSFSMPMALLASTLLVVGRVSADNELTAARACGISFLQLFLPVLGLAAIFTMATMYINCSLAPQTKYFFNQAFVDIAFKQPISLLEEGQFIREFNNVVIYIGKTDARHQTLRNVRITRLLDGSRRQDIYAEQALVSSDLKQLKLILTLSNARIDDWDASDSQNFQKRHWAATFEKYPIELDLTGLVDQRRATKDDNHYTSLELWVQALQYTAEDVHPTPKLVEIHKRIALSVACFSFVLIALPLGVQVQRRETSIGILISLLLAVTYYFLILFAESFKKSPQFYPELIIWLPNLLFQCIGIYLIWKQNKR
jgi:lipopolysaccharide export system permease protein